MTRPWVIVLFVACRSKSPIVDAAAPAPSALASAAVSIADASSDVALRGTEREWNVLRAVAVSSRVDNGAESPEALIDGDTDTAWSSRTGDLVGAWVAFRLEPHADVRSVALTVGMTKSADLFEQNVRIAEVQVSFDGAVLVDHFKLDTASRALQPIAVAARGRGDLKITVQAIQPGTKASWREATISEVELRGESGKLRAEPSRHSVGSFDPKPRGVLGIIPEDTVPLGCLAEMPSSPRVWCVLGRSGNESKSATLVSIDKTGMSPILALMTATTYQPRFPYEEWLRNERNARGAVTLDSKAGKEIPWENSIEVEGATIRQRATSDAGDGFAGVLEVKFPGDVVFTKVLDEVTPRPTSPPRAKMQPIGSTWLVERSASHGSEGMFMSDAEATLCDLRAHACTTYEEPPDVANPR